MSTKMSEFFVIANSFSAPFFSDTDENFVKATTPAEAMTKFREGYQHPAGLFAASVWKDANAYHKGEKALLIWLSKKAKEQKRMVGA